MCRPGGDRGSAVSKSSGGTQKGKLNPRDFIFSGKQKEVRVRGTRFVDWLIKEMGGMQRWTRAHHNLLPYFLYLQKTAENLYAPSLTVFPMAPV